MALTDEELFGTDLAVDDDGNLVALPTGDVELVRGRACLVQSLWLRVNTPRGGLLGHPEYGCDLIAFVQGDDTPETRAAAEQEVESAIEGDPRVASVRASTVSLGDGTVEMRVEVTPIGEEHPLNLVLGGGIDEVTLQVVEGLDA